ncbi:hypothetical protein [Dyadobacter sp. OTU695]|uniref:hypothetical protein n=1 Tax=Dyadobacter sp. OTU695 TaxID=3043860 RepID=UPI00313AB5FF
MEVALHRTFAGFVPMHVMLALLIVSNMRRWEWSIAVFAPMPAGHAQRLVRGWLRRFENGHKKTRRFQNEPACQITLHQQTKNQIKLIRKKSLVKFFLL